MSKGHFTIKLEFKSRKMFVQTKVVRRIAGNTLYTVKNILWNKKPYFALDRKFKQKIEIVEIENVQKTL